MFFKRLYIRKRLKEVARLKAEDTARLNVHSQVKELLIELNPKLFDRYTKEKGQKIILSVIRTNLEEALELLDACREAIVERTSLPSQALLNLSNESVVSLDYWLSTRDNYPVEPRVAWEMLHERLSGLFTSLELCDAPAYRTSYSRKLSYVFKDSVTIMEALLKAAL